MIQNVVRRVRDNSSAVSDNNHWTSPLGNISPQTLPNHLPNPRVLLFVHEKSIFCAEYQQISASSVIAPLHSGLLWSLDICCYSSVSPPVLPLPSSALFNSRSHIDITFGGIPKSLLWATWKQENVIVSSTEGGLTQRHKARGSRKQLDCRYWYDLGDCLPLARVGMSNISDEVGCTLVFILHYINLTEDCLTLKRVCVLIRKWCNTPL